ncbi:hypothetical protein Back2_13620 [Nocardioides baekrokdamisoli]|uniref:Uncharacterized protein n=1 Tax=Nocardioides baekrokdamisoli TaxID=1804624 RepID=A0A3G9IM43_9ACTN|nr:hypothetical protein Back2_13620 [Nocardioides baekrokdamisoli]
MRWYRRMKRRAQCRRRYGDECPHIENHSGQPRTWVPLTRLESPRGQHAAMPAWHAEPGGGRGMGARADRVAPVAFVPESRDEGGPNFPHWEADPKSATRGVSARSQPPAN